MDPTLSAPATQGSFRERGVDAQAAIRVSQSFSVTPSEMLFQEEDKPAMVGVGGKLL